MRRRDADDVPFVVAAQAVGATAVLTHDQDFGGIGTQTATAEILVDLRDYARSKAIALQIKVGGGVIVIPVTAAFAGLGKALAAMGRIIARAPAWLVAVLLGAGVLLVLHPNSRAAIAGAASRAGKLLNELIDVAAPVLIELADRVRAAEETASTAWDRTVDRLPAAPRPTARQLAYSICVSARRPLDEEQIFRKMLAHGYVPRGSGTVTYLRRILQRDPRFKRRADSRWDVARAGLVTKL